MSAPVISFEIDWLDVVDDVECKTLASISLIIDETPIWPIKGEIADDFEWYADELLAHLTECWKPLVLRQTYPIPVRPEWPSFLIVEAEKRWSDAVPDTTVEAEQRQIAAFEDAHNLANAFGGITGLLPLWFLRDQDMMIIDTREVHAKVPLHQAIDALVSTGDAIAKRLREADEQKWSKLLKAWSERDKGDGVLLLAFAIGHDRKTAAELIAEKVLEAPISVSDAANDVNELRIAARMAGPMPLPQIKSVIEKVRSCDPRTAPALEKAAAKCMEFIESEGLRHARPHTQGSELAAWLRRAWGLSAQRTVNPFNVLEKRLDVDVRAIDFGVPSLDAIAVWGPNHGPGVLLNQTSSRVRNSKDFWKSGALRVTAAHELCHLLLDSRHPLSAVDVLGGRMPIKIEQRAKAFAAEFLLPSKEAADVWKAAGNPFDLNTLHRLIKMLCSRHKVTESVAAWQLQHGAPVTDWDDLDRALDQLVPHR